MVSEPDRKEGKDMKRALIVTMIAGAFALSTTLPLPAFSEETVPVPAPDAIADTTACALGDGTMVAAGGGCCQRQGGVCGCRGGSARCCDGSAGACPCRGNSTPPEEI
jgi:hypothetical protein